MKLLDLEPRFLKRCPDGSMDMVDSLSEADGVIFLCPVCFQANNGRVGTHSIICWRPRVPLDVNPKPGRWEFSGAGLADLTLTAGSSSVLLQTAPCRAHFHIRGGEVIL